MPELGNVYFFLSTGFTDSQCSQIVLYLTLMLVLYQWQGVVFIS